MSFSFSGSLPFMLLFFAIVNVLANKYSLSLSLSLCLCLCQNSVRNVCHSQLKFTLQFLSHPVELSYNSSRNFPKISYAS